MQHILKTNKALLALLFVCYASLSASAQKYPYQNPDLSAKERAKDLCSRLTLEEKAMLMLDESCRQHGQRDEFPGTCRHGRIV